MGPRRPFIHSLLGRMVLGGIVPAAATFVVVLVIAGWRSFDSLKRDRVEILLESAESAAMTIDAQNLALVSIGRTVADAAGASLLGRRPESIAFLKEVLRRNPEIVGICFGYETDADGLDAASVGDPALAGAIDEHGRFIPYVKRDPSSPEGLLVENLIDIDDPATFWYAEPKRLAAEGRIEPVITMPYEYSGIDLIEQMNAIVVDGEFKGVVGVDRSLERIGRAVESAVDGLQGDAFLLTRGLFVAATTDAALPKATRARDRLQTTRVADSPYADLYKRLVADRRTRFVAEAMDPVLGEMCFYAVATVPTGDWTLVVRLPRSVLLAPVLAAAGGNAIVAAAGLSIVVGLLVTIARRMSRRIGMSLEALERIAGGDLGAEVPQTNARDETGDLCRGVGRMRDGLRAMLGEIQGAALRLESTADEVAAGSRSQSETASTFGASVSQIAAASREIAATAEELRGSMERVDEAASDTAERASSGRDDLERMQRSMGSLEEGTRSVGTRLSAIDEKADAIGEVVVAINKVAEQTNLLSVNAALEAEKAGEFGVGFMVVAREIRRLADQTAEATLDIERMVRQMQEAVADGVAEMGRFDRRVQDGVAEASRLASEMGRMIDRVRQGSDEVGQVRDGMESQSQGAVQINDSISSLAVGAQQARDSAVEFSAAAGELQAALKTLCDAVSRFEVGAEAG
jgi:methyl-accepting chemotaxis protein